MWGCVWGGRVFIGCFYDDVFYRRVYEMTDNLAELSAGLAGEGGFSGIGTEFEIRQARGVGRQ